MQFGYVARTTFKIGAKKFKATIAIMFESIESGPFDYKQ